MIRSDFNLSEGLNFHRAGQASPPLGRSVAHHSKRPIHAIYSQLFSRERERQLRNFYDFMIVIHMILYNGEESERERRRGFVSG